MNDDNNINANDREQFDNDQTKTTSDRKLSGLGRVSLHVSTTLGHLFYNLGAFIANHPWKTIFGSWILVGICSLGLIRFHIEKDPLKLWVPTDSDFLHSTKWMVEKFEEGIRLQSVLITAPNVLEPEVLAKVAEIGHDIRTFSIIDNKGEIINWDNVCYKIPMIAPLVKKRVRRNVVPEDNAFDDDFFGNDDDNYYDTTEDVKKNEKTTTISSTIIPVTRNLSIEGTTSYASFEDDGFFEQANDIETIFDKKRRPFYPSVDLSPSIFCGIFDKFPLGCLQQSFVELWYYDKKVIENLTKDDIIKALNYTKINPMTGHDLDLEPLLGGVEYDESGAIISATSILSHFMVYVNFSDTDSEKVGNMAGTEDWVSEKASYWEYEFIQRMLKIQENLKNTNISMYFVAGRSYADLSAEAMFKDTDKLSLGIILMFIYMQLVISKFSWTEIRITLGSVGLLSVGMGFISGCGICSLLGISYGPVHTSLPFLLMGLGVDDMFVMMACYRKVQADHPELTLSQKMGFMLQHAGASITLTSITDIVAFGVGASTVLPSLHSFCLFAAASIFMMFIYVITFFVAVFTLDEIRLEAKRNAFIPCIFHTEETSKIWCSKNLMHRFLDNLLKKFVLTKLGKIMIILGITAVTGYNIDGLFRLKQQFDPIWFIPESSYYTKFVMKVKETYPEYGHEAIVLMGGLNYSAEINNIMWLTNELENQTGIIHGVKSWVTPFKDFVELYHEKDITEITLTDNEFRKYLSQFLHGSTGGKFQPNFKFAKKMQCGQPTPQIIASTIEFKFKQFPDRDIYIPAKYIVQDLVKKANFNSGDAYSTIWARIFGNWVTDEIIDKEIYRNIALALAGVIACSAILIVNLQICFWIFICVLLTLVNVGGLMYRWGLTLDLVSCIALQLAVGLCVDYAAHIGHTFLTVNDGDLNKRAYETVMHIGAAVLYGGGSTILALSVLSISEAYTYRIFFKIFLLVIFFGLFNGIILLPVILSILGPAPYIGAYKPEKKSPEIYAQNGKEMVCFIDKSKSDKLPETTDETKNAQSNILIKNAE